MPRAVYAHIQSARYSSARTHSRRRNDWTHRNGNVGSYRFDATFGRG